MVDWALKKTITYLALSVSPLLSCVQSFEAHCGYPAGLASRVPGVCVNVFIMRHIYIYIYIHFHSFIHSLINLPPPLLSCPVRRVSRHTAGTPPGSGVPGVFGCFLMRHIYISIHSFIHSLTPPPPPPLPVLPCPVCRASRRTAVPGRTGSRCAGCVCVNVFIMPHIYAFPFIQSFTP